uniref:Uncharacterized protein n=1 Tax=viral metagenome TaxID=1070528 RepID=A0A6M3JMY3_9ZZZZ
MESLDKILDEFSKNRETLLVMKAYKGYSAVVVPQEIYREVFLLRDHYNGATPLLAAQKAIKERRKICIN